MGEACPSTTEAIGGLHLHLLNDRNGTSPIRTSPPIYFGHKGRSSPRITHLPLCSQPSPSWIHGLPVALWVLPLLVLLA